LKQRIYVRTFCKLFVFFCLFEILGANSGRVLVPNRTKSKPAHQNINQITKSIVIPPIITLRKEYFTRMSKHPLIPILTSVVAMLITLGAIVGSYSIGIGLLFWAPPAWAADICLLQITSAIVVSIVAIMAVIDYIQRSEGIASIKNEKPTNTNSANALLPRKGSRTGLVSYDSSPRLNRGLFSPVRSKMQ
jgi:hypothetical protein